MTELDIQQQVADYLRLQYPDVIFHSDYGSGIKLTMGQAVRQKRLNGGRRSWPDMFIAEPRTITFNHREYRCCGMFLELKRPGVKIYKKNGELVANEHIREQKELLDSLQTKGYYANFACGFDEAKEIIDWYLRWLEF